MNKPAPPDNSQLTHFLISLLRLLIAFGMPAASWTFAQSVTKNLWQQLIITIGGLFAGLFISFLSKLWQEWETSLVSLTTNWSRFMLKTILSRYRRRYYQHLIYEHQVFDVRGLSTQMAHSLELEHVFVLLDMSPTPAPQASTNLLKVPQQLSQGEHNIWDYLSSSPLAGQHFVIVGPPGSGKTTLLKHIVLTLAQPKKAPRSHSRVAHKLPIFLFLRDHVETIKMTPDCTLIDLVENHLQKKWQQTIPARWLADHLKRGRCLIMLDGLDEIADAATRKQVVVWVQHQMLAYLHNRFILTSRPYGYNENPLDGVTILEVRPFTLKQIKQFIQQWYLANEYKSWGKDDPGMRMRAREGAEDVLHKLYQTPALLDLAVNPLLLTMIVTIHHVRHALPGKRVELYREICDVLLGKRREDIGIEQGLSAAQMQLVLQPLAYHLMQQKTLLIKIERACKVIKPYLSRVSATMQPETFLRTVEHHSGLLLEQNPGTYGFVLKTFQEYLAAVHTKTKKLEQELINHIGDSWWHETIRLYCAQNDATHIIEACLSQANMSVETLMLAIECNEEKLEAQTYVDKRVKEILEKGAENPDTTTSRVVMFDEVQKANDNLSPVQFIARRQVIAEALLNRRLQQMVYLRNSEVYADTSLVTSAEYQLFLDQAHNYQPLHWQSDTFLPGQGRAPLLGIQARDALAFCKWLNKRDASTWHYRLPRQAEASQVKALFRQSGKNKGEIGYWLNDGQTFAWASDSIPEYNELEQMLQSILDNDLKQAHTFSHIHSAAFDHPVDQALYFEQRLDQKGVLAFNLSSAGDLHQARGLHFAQFDDLLQAITSKKIELSLIKDPDEHTSIITLSAAIFQATARLNQAKTLNDGEGLLLRWFIRYSSQLLARVMDHYNKQASTLWGLVPPSSSAPLPFPDYSQYRKIYTCGYIIFALLELRIQGKLPPWEGILLVKERRKM
jgi:energy-coupling factor transporter ATP-binding protein EcfA2